MASTGSFATSIPFGSPLAAKIYGAMLLADQQRGNNLTNSLIGPAPTQAEAERKLRGQTSPDMPVVRINDLREQSGDRVGVDIFGTLTGEPIVGDDDAEGSGAALSSASQEIRIDLRTKVADRGGKMTRQRTKHELRGIARANVASYFLRLQDQDVFVHAAGARGSQADMDWIYPLAGSANFDKIAINPVVAPSFGSHFIADGSSVVGASEDNIEAIASTDILTLDHIDALRTIIDEMAFPLQPVRIVDDPAANDDPLYVLYVSPRQWKSLLNNPTNNIRSFQQNAWNRASYGSKSPLFKGEVGMWNGILVRKLKRAIRFNPGDAVSFVAAANAATATESTADIPALGAGFAVDRAILMGAQAVGIALGRSGTRELNNGTAIAGGYFNWLENPYNFGRNAEIAGDSMAGTAKIRFDLNGQVRDHGVMVLDTVVPLTN
jgi:N4-gp56 family major capsid protein